MDFPLRLIQPGFDSPLTDVVLELEHLRRLQLGGDTPPPIFFQLKAIFHLLESLGSARIEGNHTTLADYIETRVEPKAQHSDAISEIENIEQAMEYLEQQQARAAPITHKLIRELHEMTVSGLKREGDRTPGTYRASNVRIAGSEHVPPEAHAAPTHLPIGQTDQVPHGATGGGKHPHLLHPILQQHVDPRRNAHAD